MGAHTGEGNSDEARRRFAVSGAICSPGARAVLRLSVDALRALRRPSVTPEASHAGKPAFGIRGRKRAAPWGRPLPPSILARQLDGFVAAVEADFVERKIRERSPLRIDGVAVAVVARVRRSSRSVPDDAAATRLGNRRAGQDAVMIGAADARLRRCDTPETARPSGDRTVTCAMRLRRWRQIRKAIQTGPRRPAGDDGQRGLIGNERRFLVRRSGQQSTGPCRQRQNHQIDCGRQDRT